MEVNKNLFVSTAQTKNNETDNEEDWSTPSRPFKSPAKVTKESKYGEVSIFTQSRFASLSGQNEKGDDIDSQETEEGEIHDGSETQGNGYANLKLAGGEESKVLTDRPGNNEKAVVAKGGGETGTRQSARLTTNEGKKPMTNISMTSSKVNRQRAKNRGTSRKNH